MYQDEDIESLFSAIKSKHGVLHGLVHAIAFAKAEDLRDTFVNTSRDGFLMAMDISVYSFIAVANKAQELMTEGGSIITLTYGGGSARVSPGYNVMGVAKSALGLRQIRAQELGGEYTRQLFRQAIKTMSAKGIQSFSDILSIVGKKPS